MYNPNPQTPTMTTLLEQHLGLILDKQATFAAHIDLDADWSADLEHGELDIGDASLTARGIGSSSRQSQSWLWLWANRSVALPADAAQSAKTLRDYGRRQAPASAHNDNRTLFQTPADTALLNTEQFLLNEAELPNLGIIACALTGADAYYYGDYDSGLALFTLHEPELARLWQTENGLPRTLATLAQITASPVNHRRAIRAYLQAKHYRLEESARQLRAHSRDGSLTADFDTADRLTNLHSEIHPT